MRWRLDWVGEGREDSRRRGRKEGDEGNKNKMRQQKFPNPVLQWLLTPFCCSCATVGERPTAAIKNWHVYSLRLFKGPCFGSKPPWQKRREAGGLWEKAGLSPVAPHLVGAQSQEQGEEIVARGGKKYRPKQTNKKIYYIYKITDDKKLKVEAKRKQIKKGEGERSVKGV